MQGLPWWSSGEEFALFAGDMGSIPHWGTEIPHDVEQLSPCTAITDPRALDPVRHTEDLMQLN